MYRFALGFLGIFLLASVAQANAISEDDLRPHIAVLASDAFEGREPGTEGERKTTAYISEQWAKAGLKPAATDGSWLDPVQLIRRGPGGIRMMRAADLRPRRGEIIALRRGDIIFVPRSTLGEVANFISLFRNALPIGFNYAIGGQYQQF